MKPNNFTIAMYPTVAFNEEEILNRLLDVFESNEKSAPTHWGNCETVQVEYNRQEIIEKVISERRVSEVHLYHDKQCTINSTSVELINYLNKKLLINNEN
ncbi:hypothetical protein OCF62_27380 [Bacillus wiedmannii]|nr:hypothetical protein [Bacillus wiedmannii]MCU5518222.1 hypothetical protein [Bacillus wiedmannii]